MSSDNISKRKTVVWLSLSQPPEGGGWPIWNYGLDEPRPLLCIFYLFLWRFFFATHSSNRQVGLLGNCACRVDCSQLQERMYTFTSSVHRRCILVNIGFCFGQCFFIQCSRASQVSPAGARLRCLSQGLTKGRQWGGGVTTPATRHAPRILFVPNNNCVGRC